MDTLPSLFSEMQIYGYIALWVYVFLGSAGVPIPVDPLLLAAGALAGYGQFNPAIVALVAISAAGCGDVVGYLFGYAVGDRAAARLQRSRIGQRFISASTLERGRVYFARYGAWAIFLSRWLVGAFSGAVNVLAGARRFPFLRFFAYAIVGETLDVAIMLGLGIAFGASWGVANNLVKVISFAALGIIVVALIVVRIAYRAPRGATDVRPANPE